MKRALWVLPLLLLLTSLRLAAAQDQTLDTEPDSALLDWIPADFAAFIQIDMSVPQSTLNDLNLLLYLSSVIQPKRLSYSQALSYDALFPLNNFDMENASFSRNVLTWLSGDLIIAYHDLDGTFNASADETVFMLPTDDSFQAATALRSVIGAQDFAQQETYRGVLIYLGDQTAFAFTPTAILIGAQPLLHAILDTMDGQSMALTASPVYQAVRAELPDNDMALAYLNADVAKHALNVLLSGGDGADPLFATFAEVLADVGNPDAAQRLLLSGAVDGIGVSADYQRLLTTGQAVARAAVHTTKPPQATDTAFDAAVLDLIPRSAMIVESGANARDTALMALYGLPLTNFASGAVAAFPIEPTVGSQVLPTPSAAQAQDAIQTFMTALAPVLDVQGDLLDHLDGSYAIALLARPNNPTPVLNTPFDVLIVAQTDADHTADVVENVATLLSTFTQPLASENVAGQAFQSLRDPAGAPVVQIGSVDDLLVIGTGSAAQQAVAAWQGDNRLIAQDRWQALSKDAQIPYLYVDVNAYYNVFLPTAGGSTSQPISQMGVHSYLAADQMIVFEVIVRLLP